MKAQIVSFHCVLKNKLGRVISSTFNNGVITCVEGGSSVLEGLVKGLQDLKKGERRRICLSADQAYGWYDPEKVLVLPVEELPRKGKPRMGETFRMVSTDGIHHMFRVVQIKGEFVTLDGNHPLAGQDLVFEIEATDARDATPEELAESSPLMEAPSGTLLH